jgi:hypothetical protein
VNGFTVIEAEDEDDDAPRRGRRPRRAMQLAELLDTAELWRSADGVAHASLPSGAHREHVRVASRGFRDWLLAAYYAQHGAGLSGTALAEAVALAEARALSSGDTRRAWRRVALAESGELWLDLGGGDARGERRAVRIAPEGWRVVDAAEVPVAFLRAPDALPLPAPEPDAARAEDLARFVSVRGADDAALCWAWLLCALRPFAEGGAYPALLLSGEQGCGKSYASRCLQALVDPSTLGGRALPREERDLFVSAANRHLLALDNLSGIPDGLADCLCRLATGGGFSARALHTDADEAVLSALRPLLLNGIPSTLLARPDLADRALALELHRPAERKREAELAADFAAMRPGLLGVLCDGLAAALRHAAGMEWQHGEAPRMLDAALWAEAGAEGLGFAPGRISAAWAANRFAADRALLEADDVARGVVALLGRECAKTCRLDVCATAEGGRACQGFGAAEWKGAPAELFALLTEAASERVTRSPLWPKNAAGLGTKLRRLAPALRAVHRIHAEAGKGGADAARFWLLSRRP